MFVSPHRSRRARRAAAAVEMAIVVPFLAFMFLVAVDFCRIFYYTQAVTTGARNGALYLSDPNGPNQSRYATLQDAVQADADSSYASQLSVSSTSGTDAVGPYTIITVNYTFNSLTRYPGIPATFAVSRSAMVRPAPAVAS
jgi:Flp pilus assembly protein TadG